MRKKCFIASCESHKSGGKFATFKSPKDPELLHKWAVAVRPYSNGKELLAVHRLCSAHFTPDDVENYFVTMVKDTEVKIERHRPELKKGAVPSLFPGQRKGRKNATRRAEQKKQAILLSNGEWVHIQNASKTPKKRNMKNLSSIKNLIIGSPDEVISVKSPQFTNSSLLSTQNSVVELQLPQSVESKSIIRSLPVQHDKDISPLCINWAAVPLPEEIGSLLCDSAILLNTSSSEFQNQTPNNNILSSPVDSSNEPLTQPIYEEPNNCEILENIADFNEVQPAFPEPSHPNNTIENLSVSLLEEEVLCLAFQDFLQKCKEVKLPSSLWAVHCDESNVFYSSLSYDSREIGAVPKVEKIIMFEGSMRPRVFLHGAETTVPSISDQECGSLDDVHNALMSVHNIRVCIGASNPEDGGTASYSPNCHLYIFSGRVPRCQACRMLSVSGQPKRRRIDQTGKKQT